MSKTAASLRPGMLAAGQARRSAPGAWAVAMVLTAVCVFVPFAPEMPRAGLDPSWMVAMNEAVARGLRIGQDVVFTFGPYASVFTRTYHPATAGLMWGASLLLGLCYGLVLALLLQRSSWWVKGGLLLALAAMALRTDALLFSYPLAAGVLACIRAQRRAAGRDLLSLALTGLVFLPFGLLPLVKGSMLVLVCAILAIACLAWLRAKQPGHMLAAGASCFGGMVLFWAISGQPLSGLLPFLASMGPIIAGYTEAMAIGSRWIEILAFVAAAAYLVFALWKEQAAVAWPDRAPLLLCFVVVLFLAFKAGFVRHDNHAFAAGGTILFAGLVAAGLFPCRRTTRALQFALVAWLVIDAHYGQTLSPRLLLNVDETFGSPVRAAQDAALGTRPLESAYADAMAGIRAKAVFTDLPGSTDIYPVDQAELIAGGNAWNPRPVFQSYSAYTPQLARMNAAHLEAATAPDNVIFRLQTIDGRLPALDDGASWLELLRRYDRAALRQDTLLLKKRDGAPRSLPQCGAAREAHRLGEAVALPEGHCAVFATLHIAPTFAGRLLSLAFKPTQLRVSLVMEDGSKRDYKMLPAMAGTEFLLSPLVETTAGFAQLFGPQAGGKRVRSFTVSARGANLSWRADYELELRRVQLAAPAR